MQFTPPQLGALLAGLRALNQEPGLADRGYIRESMTDGGDYERLSAEAIDALCRELNTDPTMWRGVDESGQALVPVLVRPMEGLPNLHTEMGTATFSDGSKVELFTHIAGAAVYATLTLADGERSRWLIETADIAEAVRVCLADLPRAHGVVVDQTMEGTGA